MAEIFDVGARVVTENAVLHARVKALESERDALREALMEVHGTEPSTNFTNGKPVDYCPLCDDGVWPCKVALLLDPTLKGGGRT